MHAGIHTPWQTLPGQTPPGQTPPGRQPLGRHTPFADTPPGRHPQGRHPPHPVMATAADGTHPTGMHYCLQKIIHFKRHHHHSSLFYIRSWVFEFSFVRSTISGQQETRFNYEFIHSLLFLAWQVDSARESRDFLGVSDRTILKVKAGLLTPDGPTQYLSQLQTDGSKENAVEILARLKCENVSC